MLVQALERFRRSQRSGMWLYLEKDQLVQEVAATVENPFLVYQERSALSGVAAVVFELARRQPLRYIAVCQELYESGAFVNNGRLLEPSPKLRKSYPQKAMRTVDWLLLATMRDIEATLFPISKVEMSSMTSHPDALRNWAKELLGLSQTYFMSTVVFGAIEALYQAVEVIKQRGVVFVLVDVGIFGTAGRPTSRHPHHWLAFINAMGLSVPTMATFTLICHSWGQRHQIQINSAGFEEHVFGVLFAQSESEISGETVVSP